MVTDPWLVAGTVLIGVQVIIAMRQMHTRPIAAFGAWLLNAENV
jgi:hypothetical protein